MHELWNHQEMAYFFIVEISCVYLRISIYLFKKNWRMNLRPFTPMMKFFNVSFLLITMKYFGYFIAILVELIWVCVLEISHIFRSNHQTEYIEIVFLLSILCGWFYTKEGYSFNNVYSEPFVKFSCSVRKTNGWISPW